MGLPSFATNVTLDGCVDHREGIADDETHDFFTRLTDESESMIWGRVTYERMESYWPAVARGAEDAPLVLEWAVKLETKPKYVARGLRYLAALGSERHSQPRRPGAVRAGGR